MTAPRGYRSPHYHHAAGARVALWHGRQRGNPTLLLIHGGRASSAWWAPVEPLIEDAGFDWIAMELTGHGASDRRTAYALSGWEAEIDAVIRATPNGRLAAVVAHSLGGAVAVGAPALKDSDAPLLIVLDAVPAHSLPEPPREPRRRPSYPSRQDAMNAFMTHPRRRGWSQMTREAVADRFIIRTAEGWSWNYDDLTDMAVRDANIAPEPHRAMLIVATESVSHAPCDTHPFWAGRPQHRIECGHDVMAERPEDTVQAIAAGIGLYT